MQRFAGNHWKDHIETYIRPAVEQFGSITSSRIWPVFENIDHEARDLEERRRQEMMAEVEASDSDYYWNAGEAISGLAYEEASRHHEMLSLMRWATLGLFSAGLYHLTEQHLVELPLAILQYHQQSELRWKRGRQPDDAIDWFKDELGLDVKGLSSWTVIDEMRLVANVTKHGDGNSADALRQKHPMHFVYPSLRQKGNPVAFRVKTPLFGNGVYITPEMFEGYREGSALFWTEFAAKLPMLTREGRDHAR